MATQPFDPYAKWLGIPKNQRPPTHYQLLGIAADEADPEVIEEAAIRQSTHVRSYQSGQYARECARILNEIALARVTLLDPVKRRAYDATLVKSPAELPDVLQALPPLVEDSPRALPADTATDVWGTHGAPPLLRSTSRRSKAKGSRIAIFAATFVCGVGLIVAAILYFSGVFAPTKNQSQASRNDEIRVVDSPIDMQRPSPSRPLTVAGPVDPPTLPSPLPPPRGNPVQPITPDYRPRETPPPGYSRPDPPRPARPVFPAGRGNTLLFQAGDLMLLTINGICKLDLATGRVGLTHRLDIEFPHALFFRSPEELFVVSGRTQTGSVGVFQPDGSRVRSVTGVFPPNAKGRWPMGGCIVVDAQGNAFIPRRGDYGLTKITPDGNVAILNRNEDLVWGEPIAIAPNGEIFITASVVNQASVHRVFRIDAVSSQMTELFQAPDGGVTGMATDASGPLYFCTRSQVLKLPRGAKTPQVLTEVNRGYRMAIGPDGGLYVISNDSRPSLWRIDPNTGEKKLAAEMLPHATDLAFVPNAATEAAMAPPPTRPPVPDDASVERATKQIRELYKSEYAKKRSAEWLALSNTLLKQAQVTLDDSVARYALFREALELAIQAGDLNQAWNVIAQWTAEYDVDGLALRFRALSTIAKSAPVLTSPQAQHELIQDALHWSVEVRATDDFELALNILAIAETVSRKLASTDPGAKAVQTVVRETRERQKEFQEAEAARAMLEKEPDNAKASFAIGRYLCLSKGDWTAGLSYLAKGDDAGLKALAEQELQVAADTTSQLALADAWWDYGSKETGRNKLSTLRRAAHWYREALPQLSGLAKTRVDQRLSQIPEPVDVPGLGPIRKTVQVSARTYLDPNMLPKDAYSGIRVQAGQTLIIRASGSWHTASTGKPRDAKGLLAIAVGEVGKRPLLRVTMNDNQYETRIDQTGYVFLGIATTPTRYYGGALTVQIEVRPEKK